MESRDHQGDFAGRLRLVADLIGGQSELARRAGMSLSGLRLYLRKGEPTLSKLIDLAAAGEVDLKWLAVGEGEMKPADPRSLRQKVRDEIAVVVKTVEEATQAYAWSCTPQEKAEMVTSVWSQATDRLEAGLPEWDMGEILRRLREIHAKHSPPPPRED